jgi:hypothetical protein
MENHKFVPPNPTPANGLNKPAQRCAYKSKLVLTGGRCGRVEDSFCHRGKVLSPATYEKQVATAKAKFTKKLSPATYEKQVATSKAKFTKKLENASKPFVPKMALISTGGQVSPLKQTHTANKTAVLAVRQQDGKVHYYDLSEVVQAAASPHGAYLDEFEKQRPPYMSDPNFARNLLGVPDKEL